MRAHRNAFLMLAALAMLAVAAADVAQAQKYGNRGTPNVGASRPPSGGGGNYGGNRGGGYRGPGWGAVVPGIIMAIPPSGPGPGAVFVDDGTVDDGPRAPRRPPQRATRRGPSGAPPANERRLVPDEVVIGLSNSVTPQQVDALQRRHRLTRIESQPSQLAGITMYRWRIPDRRSVPAVVRELEADNVVASAQPNYLFTLQESEAPTAAAVADELPQYELAKLNLPRAHELAKGDNILIAVIDSGIDVSHPELAGAIAGSFDALTTPMAAHKHGTGIAGMIVAHGKLKGAAPAARILAVRAFDPKDAGAEGTTFNILKGLDWAAAQGARVINMSFAGPSDPAIAKSLAAAHKKGIVLIAAAGNAGAKSPPLYPAADANVIAVTATDADDKLVEQSNRGRHVAIAAPGAQLLVAIPDGGYEIASGTSYSAAEVSGIAALMLERKGDLSPNKLRDILLATAKDLGPKGRDAMFGAGLADAYGALTMDETPVAAAAPMPRPAVKRVSTGAR